MAGASRQHNRIVTNVVVSLDTQLRERPCNVYSLKHYQQLASLAEYLLISQSRRINNGCILKLMGQMDK